VQSGRNLPRIWSRGIHILGAMLLWPINFVGWLLNIRWSAVRDLFGVTSLTFRFLGNLCILVLDEPAASIFRVEEPDFMQGVLNDHLFSSARLKRPHLDVVSLSGVS